MTRYLIRRVALLMLTLLLTSMIIFALTQLLPGDIARLMLGRQARPEAIANLRLELGLDAPVTLQYLRWLGGFVTGDWGKSYTGGAYPIRPIVMERLGNSARLAVYTLILCVPLAIGLGVLAALRENRWVDSVISVFSLAVVGLPEFVTGIVLINVFALGLGWFPPISSVSPDYTLGDWLRVLTLPAVTASFVLLAYIIRMTRAGVLEELKKDYVRAATLKGLPRRQVILKHVLRNALLPTITVIAISVGWLMGGLIVIENVFNYPGLGQLLIESVERKNIPMLQAVSMVTIFFFALANLIADLLYALLNPRVRLG